MSASGPARPGMAGGGAPSARRVVRFVGRVQGVYFRATAESVARDHAVTGWVRNEPDGSVLLVAEGAPDELERFVAAVLAAKRANVDRVESRVEAATGEFSSFAIRR